MVKKDRAVSLGNIGSLVMRIVYDSFHQIVRSRRWSFSFSAWRTCYCSRSNGIVIARFIRVTNSSTCGLHYFPVDI